MIRLIGFLLLVFPLVSQACWPLKERTEIDGFAELDDVLILSFKDAVSCKPLANAKLMIGELEFEADAQGYVKLPMAPFNEMMDSRAAIKVSKQGYIDLNTELIVAAGTVLNRRMVLSPALPPGKVRFVLQWNEEPQDLDLHLKGPGFHVSYRHKRSVPNKARLDRDEMEGYGPETITLDKVRDGSRYSLWVDNYSNDDQFQGTEQVFVYNGNQLLKILTLPQSKQRGIHVLTIEQSDFNYINQPVPQRP